MWFRRPTSPLASNKVEDRNIRQYIEQESNVMLSNLIHAIPGQRWISNPINMEQAAYKPYNIRVAQEIGFEIPETIISNSPEGVEKFMHNLNLEYVALKPVETPWIKSTDNSFLFFTKKIHKNRISEWRKQIQVCPVILQEYIEKSVELRITVIDNQVFPCAIHSQRSELTKEDWRKYDIDNTPHETFQLPEDIKQKCVALLKNLGIRFGCIDMILTPENRYVFLEINPAGQWLWIEELTGLSISKTLTHALVYPTEA